jgi:hypothetical protein
MTDIDRLTAQLDSLVEKIDRTLDADLAKRKQTFHLEHDDGNGDGEINASDPTADDNYDNPGDDYDDELDDEDDIAKASVNEYLRENNSSNRSGSLERSSHTSSSNSRHKFEAFALQIKNDRGVPLSEAMAQARAEFPDAYRDYQRWQGTLGKRGPTTYEDLVNAEMAKGLNAECAAQRVAQLHGFRAFDHRNISKREAVAVVAEDELMKAAQEAWEDGGVSRCEALREARSWWSPRQLVQIL